MPRSAAPRLPLAKRRRPSVHAAIPARRKWRGSNSSALTCRPARANYANLAVTTRIRKEVVPLPASVRLLCTNDFSGTWDPTPYSAGWLPGGRGLQRAVESLRQSGPAMWLDAGDHGQGGAVSGLSEGTAGWSAAASLGIDCAVPGNHEFDWGPERFRRMAAECGLDYVCANADMGVPATKLVSAGSTTLGIIGMTYPRLADLSPDLAMVVQPSPGEIVPDAARQLRREGADFVVAIVHDGVTGPSAPGRGPDRTTLEFLGSWYSAVDAVAGGHTLWRCLSVVDDVAICQADAFGGQIGVVELTKGAAPRVGSVQPEPAGYWDGPGADLLAEARSRVVATREEPIASVLGPNNPLLTALARSLRVLSSADAAIVGLWDCWVTQPIRDKVTAYIPSGTFTVADLLRVTPHAYEPVGVVTVSRDHYPVLRELAFIPFLPTLGESETSSAARLRVALSHRQASAAAVRLGEQVDSVDYHGSPLRMVDVWAHALSRGGG